MAEVSDLAKIWLFVFVSMYWAYCVFWGIKGAIRARTASDYFIAGRTIPVYVFVLAATATSFSGWTFIGHPGLIYSDGFPYAYASLYTITIPFTGVLFMRRQWILGKRNGYVTPGEMFADYYRSGLMRILTVLVALFFSIPYLGVQLRASGFLFNVLSGNTLDVEVGMWLLSIVVILYVALGGLRSVAYVDTMQCLLLAVGILIVGLITLCAVGGWRPLVDGIAQIARLDSLRTDDGYSHFLALPGAIQNVTDSAQARGGGWTGIMCLTYMFALMGIQSSPAFSMWAFSNKDPRPFAPQQVWASAAGIGFLLVIFTAIQGMGGHLLGADPIALKQGFGRDLLGIGDLMQTSGKGDVLVPSLIAMLSRNYPWLMGFLAICALAAMQSTGALYMSTAGAMLTRDIYKWHINRRASHLTQKLFARAAVVALCGFALLVATTSKDALVLLGGLAVAYGFQMWPALIGVCWWPWLTRAGVCTGLIAGLITVTLTDSIGQEWLGITLWGRYPFTIHSAGWGILVNFTLAILISALTQDEAEKVHKMQFHHYVRAHCELPPHLHNLKPVAWIITLGWFLFAVGPGAIIGNTIFGNPNDQGSWLLGIPSIWAWQILWWILGVGMMWFLAYKMQMSATPESEIVALLDDVGDKRK